MANLAGTNSEQVATNALLGNMAFQSSDAVLITPQASATPKSPGEMLFQLSSNTSLVIKVMGSDGVVRSNTLVLA